MIDNVIDTPAELRFLQRLAVVGTQSDGLSLEITLYNESRSVTIKFQGVQALTLSSVNSLSLLGPLKILDLRSRQLENINYEVRDLEAEKLSFYCKHYDIHL